MKDARLVSAGKSYGGKAVLRGFDAVFEPGVTLITGANGSGKTTVLHLLAGLLEPDEGRVEVLGASARAARGRVFLVPAEAPSMPWLAAREFIEFSAALFPSRRTESEREEDVRRLGLAPFLGKRFSELSTGTARKVVIAAAFAAAPEVLLLDEPTNELDDASAAGLIEMLEAMRGRIVVISTHQPQRFAALAPRIIALGSRRE